MTIETTKKPLLIACRNDKAIIKRMKQIGIYEQMKKLSLPGETITILTGYDLFIWHGMPGDSGYTHLKCEDLSLLLLMSAKALGNPKATGTQARH